MNMRVALLVALCASATTAASASFDMAGCLHKSKSTNDSEMCAARRADASKDELSEVVAYTVSSNDEPTSAQLIKAQELWEQFVKADCDAVYESYGQGTARGTAAQRCRFKHTIQRTKELKAWDPAHWYPVK